MGTYGDFLEYYGVALSYLHSFTYSSILISQEYFLSDLKTAYTFLFHLPMETILQQDILTKLLLQYILSLCRFKMMC
jgi:hypothetical protein